MNRFIKKIFLISMFVLCYLSLFMTWYNASGVKVLNGTSIVTRNLLISIAIIILFNTSKIFSIDKSNSILSNLYDLTNLISNR